MKNIFSTISALVTAMLVLSSCATQDLVAPTTLVPAARRIVITLNPANNEVDKVDKLKDDGTLEPGRPQVPPTDLQQKNLKFIGVLYHFRRNPDCFYYEYLGSIWEVCY